MTENRYKLANPNNLFKDMNIGIVENNTCMLKLTDVVELLNNLSDENEQLKQDIKYLEEKIKENEWHWNTIDEDRDVWHYKCTQLEKENEQLKKDRFICLDCKYCGYTEIGCLCEKQDHWEEFKSECNDFKELKY